MKTAISIPPKIFKSAEKFAQKFHLSRSKLYTTALKSYMEAHEAGSITAKLNDVYGTMDSKLDSGLKKLQSKSVSKNHW